MKKNPKIGKTMSSTIGSILKINLIQYHDEYLLLILVFFNQCFLFNLIT